MTKISAKSLFFKVAIPLLDAGLDWHECAVIHYVERLTDKSLPCFASVETMSAELRIPYGTLRRVIKRLTDSGFLSQTMQGRKRTLRLDSAYYTAINSVQNEQCEGAQISTKGAQNEQHQGAQNEQLPRSILPRRNYLDLNNLDLDPEKESYIQFKTSLLRK